MDQNLQVASIALTSYMQSTGLVKLSTATIEATTFVSGLIQKYAVATGGSLSAITSKIAKAVTITPQGKVIIGVAAVTIFAAIIAWYYLENPELETPDVVKNVYKTHYAELKLKDGSIIRTPDTLTLTRESTSEGYPPNMYTVAAGGNYTLMNKPLTTREEVQQATGTYLELPFFTLENNLEVRLQLQKSNPNVIGWKTIPTTSQTAGSSTYGNFYWGGTAYNETPPPASVPAQMAPYYFLTTVWDIKGALGQAQSNNAWKNWFVMVGLFSYPGSKLKEEIFSIPISNWDNFSLRLDANTVTNVDTSVDVQSVAGALNPPITDDENVIINLGAGATVTLTLEQLKELLDGNIMTDGFAYSPGYVVEGVRDFPVVKEDAPAIDVPVSIPMQPTPTPTLPTVGAVGSNMVTIYNPSSSELRQITSFLLSEGFVNNILKLLNDPMDYIVDLSVIPVAPPRSTQKYIPAIGNVSLAGIQSYVVTEQFMTVDFGNVTVDEIYHNALDYSPVTSGMIFLPFIGYRDINIDDIMGATINLKYNIDVFNGNCVALLNVDKTIDGNRINSVLYQWEGSVISHIPIHSTAYNLSLGSVAGLAALAIPGGAAVKGLATVAGVSAGGSVLSGVLKPNVRSSGNLSGNGGFLGVQTPYITIYRPRVATPNDYKKYIGGATSELVALSETTGMTYVEEIHLENIPATDSEIEEIITLLKGGVIL